MAKIKEIEVSRKMTISTGNFENDQPQARLVADLEEGDDFEAVKKDLIAKLNQVLVDIVEVEE